MHVENTARIHVGSGLVGFRDPYPGRLWDSLCLPFWDLRRSHLRRFVRCLKATQIWVRGKPAVVFDAASYIQNLP